MRAFPWLGGLPERLSLAPLFAPRAVLSRGKRQTQRRLAAAQLTPFNLLGVLSAPGLVCNQDAGDLPRSLPESQWALFFQSNCFKTDTETHTHVGCAKDEQVAGRRETRCAHVKGGEAFWGCRGALMNQVLLLPTPPPRRRARRKRGGGLYANNSARQNEFPAFLGHKNDKLFGLGMFGHGSKFQTPFLNLKPLFM